MKGSITTNPLPDIIRELHLTRRTGLLRLVQGKTLRAVFVEEGKLVFALSNLPGDRLGDLLLRENRLTREQYDQVMQDPNSKQRLGKILVEKGLLSAEEAESYTKKQITEIILAGFGWSEGEFSFEDNTKAAHDVKLDLLTPNIILMGVRTITDDDLIRKAVGPMTQKVQMSPDAFIQLMQATLDGTEGFLLSRINEEVSLDDLVSMCGLPESMILKVAYGLMCAGILVSDHPRPMLAGGVSSATGAFRAASGPPPKPAPSPKPSAPAQSQPVTPPKVAAGPGTPPQGVAQPAAPAEKTEQEAREEVRKLLYVQSLKSTTLYTILGVEPHTSDADLKKAYYQLAKKHHPDRYRQFGAADLLADAELVFAKIGDAYEKLKDFDTRKRYDEYIGVTPQAAAPSPVAPLPPPSFVQSPPKPPSPYSQPPRPVSPVTPAGGTPPPPSPYGHPAKPVGPMTPPAPSPYGQPAKPVGSTTQSFGQSPPSPPPPQPRPVEPAPKVGTASGNYGKDFGRTTGTFGKDPNAVGFTTGSNNIGNSGSATPATPISPQEIAHRSYNYARAAMERKDFLLATRYLREAIKHAPDTVSYRMYLADICTQNPKLRKEAEENLLHVIKVEPKNVDALLMLGKVYRAGSLEKSAKTQYEAVLKIQPNNPTATQALKDMGFLKDEPPPEEAKAADKGKSEEKAKEGSFFSKLFKR